MMGQHRWIAIFCLGLLLQQFSPVFSACIVDNEGYAVDEEDEVEEDFPYKDETDGLQDDEDEDDQEEGGLGKRNLLSGLGRLAFRALKIGLKYGDEVTSAVDLAVTLPVAIGDCNVYHPDIKTNWDRVKELDDEFNKKSKEIDDLSRDAAIMQCYGKSSMRQYRLARMKMEDITVAQKILFEAMSPKFSHALRNTTEYIKKIAKKKNGTKEEVDAIEVQKYFNSDFERVFSVVLPALQLAIPGFQRLYKRAKNTVIGSKIIDFQNDMKLRLGIPDGGPDYEPLLGSMYMGDKPGRLKRFGQLLDNVKAKYQSGHGLFSKVTKGIKGLFSLGSSALNIWSTIGTIQGCADIKKASKSSVDQMEWFVSNATEYLEDVRGAYQKGQEAWQKIVDVAWEKNFTNALGQVKDMISDKAFTSDKGLSGYALKSIKDYLDAIDNTGTPSNANGLQRRLVNALKTVPFPLNCHKIKGNMFTIISERCAAGANTFDKIYESVKKGSSYDSGRYKCALRTGEEYISVETLEDAWKEEINGNDTVEERCIFNSAAVMDTITTAFQNGATPEDAADIAAGFSSPHFADDIAWYFRTKPRPAKLASLPPLGIQKQICVGKEFADDLSEEEFLQRTKEEVYPEITLDQLRNIDCSKIDY